MADCPDPLVALRTAPQAALDAVIDLNLANEIALSPLNRDELGRLVDNAFFAAVTRYNQAFIIAFDQDADYSSPNFHWFRARYPRFVYVDRVAVADGARGKGLARRLYCDLFDAARAAGQRLIACEVNVDPPNPASDAFHDRLGFAEAGRARLPNVKTVRYLVKDLASG